MKMVIFVEGVNETIFIRNLFLEYLTLEKIIVTQPLNIRKDRKGEETFCKIRFQIATESDEKGNHECSIINAQCDEKVLSLLSERYLSMSEKGYELFFGLRDLKSKRHKKFGEPRILEEDRKEIENLKQDANIFFHYAKMETEAWYLATPSTFARIDPRLTVAEIERIIENNLEALDPETEFSNPAYQIEQIFKHADLGKYKSREGYQKVISNIDWKELCEEVRGKKISFFFRFLDDLLNALEKMNQSSPMD